MPRVTKETIAVDIDDVISAHAQAFIDYSNKRWGTHLKIDDYEEHWGSMWHTDEQETEQRAHEYHASGYIATYPHVFAAKPVLLELAKRYRLVVVTSRRTQIMTETRAWLEEYFSGVFEEVYFAGMWDKINSQSNQMTKTDIIKTIGAKYLIDDQVKHCNAAAASGIKALLFGNYSWNQTNNLRPGVIRVADWAAVKEYFDAKS